MGSEATSRRGRPGEAEWGASLPCLKPQTSTQMLAPEEARWDRRAGGHPPSQSSEGSEPQERLRQDLISGGGCGASPPGALWGAL